MPTIFLGHPKPRVKTLNKQKFQDIYQHKRWKRLRAEKLRENPLCERCEGEGITRQTEEVHHIIPFDDGMGEMEINELAFDWDNLESLCRECHDAAHKELRR